MRGYQPCIPYLHQFGKVLPSDTEKAEAFKTFFSSVFTCEDQKCLDGLEEELRSTRSEVEIGKVVVTVREVYEELCKIDPSKAAGPDGIPSRLIREGAPWIAEPLLYIFNTSLQSGQLPQDWTRANDTPKNYRPVSLTSLMVKVMEHLIQRRIMNFLTDNDKLNPFQHAWFPLCPLLPGSFAGDGQSVG